VPSPSELDALKSVVTNTDLRLLWSLVLPQAFLIAIVGSIDGLLAAVVVDAVTRGHHRSDRLLMSQGLANVVGALAGALPAQLNAHTPMRISAPVDARRSRRFCTRCSCWPSSSPQAASSHWCPSRRSPASWSTSRAA
jgi:hypothetical protein